MVKNNDWRFVNKVNSAEHDQSAPEDQSDACLHCLLVHARANI